MEIDTLYLSFVEYYANPLILNPRGTFDNIGYFVLVNVTKRNRDSSVKTKPSFSPDLQ